MKRRSFLQYIIAGLLNFFAGDKLLDTIPQPKTVKKFDPNKVYYNWVTVPENDWNPKNLELAKKVCDKQIRLAVPRQYWSAKYIKFIFHSPGPSGTGFIDEESFVGTVAWKYTPERKKVSSPRGA